ncbi:Protein of unknown function [Cotesia congregata]|uniref:SWIM-type domain-containing protein n=1 Tax=Cotesia congregata TaxID=51543 RepID=A0A8J2MC41_COTCN|nr:Protein of unknown function [Cotesia congregata]
MNKIIKVGFEKITHTIDFNKQKIVNDKKLSEVNVVDVEELRNQNQLIKIRCKVFKQTNVTDPPYKVELELNAARHVMQRSCTCVSQACGKCKHIYALIDFINKDTGESKTSEEQNWGKPSTSQLAKEIFAKPLLITDDFILKKNYGPVYDVDFSELGEINCSFRYVLKYEKDFSMRTSARMFVEDLCDDAVNDVQKSVAGNVIANLLQKSKQVKLYSRNIIFNDVKLYDYYNLYVKMYNYQILNLCLNTVKQSESQEWFSTRKNRISASQKAHLIKTSKKNDSRTLADNLVNGSKPTTKAMEYGIKNEKKAVEAYMKQFDVDVVSIGLFVKPLQSWLCASVDGIVIKNGEVMKVLEIKCPATCSSKPIFDEKTNSFNVKYLELRENEASLKKSHIYYTQCQVQMYVVGLNLCDLFIWSPKGYYVVTLKRDEQFLASLIPKLKLFYFHYYLKALVKSQKENIV